MAPATGRGAHDGSGGIRWTGQVGLAVTTPRTRTRDGGAVPDDPEGPQAASTSRRALKIPATRRMLTLAGRSRPPIGSGLLPGSVRRRCRILRRSLARIGVEMTSLRLVELLDRLRSRLWFIPGMLAIGSALLAVALSGLDRLVDRSLGSNVSGILFSGGPDSARLVLSTIAAAMLTFTGLVFTVTMLVLQLASAQLSPRVMRTFLRDRLNQSVLGLFIATFLYALLVLRDVRSPPNDAAFVPAIAVTVAYLLLLASVGLFVVYIHHMAQAIRAATVLRSVAAETREAIAAALSRGRRRGNFATAAVATRAPRGRGRDARRQTGRHHLG